MIEITPLASSSKANAYLISDGKTPLLLECGIRFTELRKACNFRLSSMAGCLLSHSHQDHAKSAKDLIKAGIDIYTSQGTAEALSLSGHRLHIVKAEAPFKINSWMVYAYNTIHDAPEPLEFLLMSGGNRIRFITDTAYTKYQIAGITHLMIEINYQDEILDQNIKDGKVPYVMKKRLLHSHLSLKNACEFLRANDLSRLKAVYLLHLSDGNSNAEEIKKTVQGITGKQTYIVDA